MTAGTHFAIPIVVAGSFNLFSISKTHQALLSRWHILLIGISGLLPDILTPHIRLQARYDSWSHTAWFLFSFFLLCIILAMCLPARHKAAAHFCWLAALLHILSDMVSGGINFIPPFGRPIGDYYLPFPYWLHLDGITILAAYIMCWYARHRLRQSKSIEQDKLEYG